MILDAFRYKAILELLEDKLHRYVLGIHVHCFTTILLQVFTTRSTGRKRYETAEEGELVKHAAAPDSLWSFIIIIFLIIQGNDAFIRVSQEVLEGFVDLLNRSM